MHSGDDQLEAIFLNCNQRPCVTLWQTLLLINHREREPLSWVGRKKLNQKH